MAQSPTARPRRARRWLWLLFLLVIALAFVAFKLGWAGYAWEEAMSRIYPRDVAILDWAPPSTPAIVLVDPHRLRPALSNAGPSAARASLERVRADIQKATGVDFLRDVDRILVTPSAVVLQGRFESAAVADRLTAATYTKSFYNGRRMLVREGEDAVMVEDEVLVYGDESTVKAAIDASAGTSLGKNDAVVARLDAIGWGSAAVGTVRLSDDRPSLREVIAGAAGPRAVTFSLGVSAPGFDVAVDVETASVGDAELLAKRLDRQRQDAEASLSVWLGEELAARVAPLVRPATVRADAASPQVSMAVHVPAGSLDPIFEAALHPGPLLARLRSTRLAELLSPAR